MTKNTLVGDPQVWAFPKCIGYIGLHYFTAKSSVNCTSFFDLFCECKHNVLKQKLNRLKLMLSEEDPSLNQNELSSTISKTYLHSCKWQEQKNLTLYTPTKCSVDKFCFVLPTSRQAENSDQGKIKLEKRTLVTMGEASNFLSHIIKIARTWQGCF